VETPQIPTDIAMVLTRIVKLVVLLFEKPSPEEGFFFNNLKKYLRHLAD